METKRPEDFNFDPRGTLERELAETASGTTAVSERKSKKKKKKSRAKGALVFAVALLLVGATAAFTYLYIKEEARKREEYVAQVNAELISLSALSFGGAELLPQSARFTVTDGRDKTEEFDLSFDSSATVELSGFGETLEFVREPESVEVVVARDGAEVFSGSAEEFAAFIPDKDGLYNVSVTATMDNASAAGTASYSFFANYAIVPRIFLSSDTVAQGDVLVVAGENLRGSADISISVPFSFAPAIERGDTSFYAYVPFNCIREPGSYEITVNYNGENTALPFTVVKTEYDVQYLTVDEETTAATIDNSAAVSEYNKAFNEINAHYDENIYWSGQFIWPCVGTITTEYGQQRYTNGRAGSPHYGIDIACAEGTPVKAAAAGVVIFSADLQMSGNTIAIEHGGGLHTIYLHMASRNVNVGDTVAQGDVIGTVGATGFATGPHLHLYTMIGDMTISPAYVLDGTSGIYKAAQYLK